MQRLIDEAHRQGIAVILDMVYGHTDSSFPYFYLYKNLGYAENPFMGPFAANYFGESTDFTRKLTQDFFFSVNHHWLSTYHVDGFRYDCVPNYWDGPTGQGYSKLVYETYRLVKGKMGAKDHWQRFFDDGEINLIQCAEQLEGPVEVLEKTYSNCTWQNHTLDAANEVAKKKWELLTQLGHRFGLMLSVGDVDLRRGLLTIRRTKFAKSRQVPLHLSTMQALSQYRWMRDLAGAGRDDDAPFFIGTRGHRFGQAMDGHQVERVFAALRSELRWVNRGMHHAPRIHDLRHTFVVRRILLWQQQGIDVDEAMRSLSTYVRHAMVTNIYWYLQAVPELMAIAAKRFESCMPELSHA